MKHLTIKQKKRLIRIAKYRLKRQKCHASKKSLGSFYLVSVPEYISFLPDHITILINFIEKLYFSARTYQRLRMDFSKTKKMYSDGTLYLLACLDNIRQTYPNMCLSMKLPVDPIVEQVLYQVGIASLMGRRKSFDSNTFHKTVRYWYAAHGENVNLSRAENIFNACNGTLTPELSKSVYAGVSEAMTNCVHHAYEGLDIPESGRKWWMFSREDDSTGRLQVVFCDLGIGIPRSLYRNSEKVAQGWWDNLKTWLAKQVEDGKAADDALKIKAAIEIGTTRTKLQHRGKGLKQMVSILDEMGRGEAFVEIISGNGRYTRRSKGEKAVEKAMPLSQNRDTAIRGTMIHWSIPLQNRELSREIKK